MLCYMFVCSCVLSYAIDTHTQHQEMPHEHPCSVTDSAQPLPGNFYLTQIIAHQGKKRFRTFFTKLKNSHPGKKTSPVIITKFKNRPPGKKNGSGRIATLQDKAAAGGGMLHWHAATDLLARSLCGARAAPIASLQGVVLKKFTCVMF